MNARITFKSERHADVQNLKEVYVGRKCVSEPYDSLLNPDTALTFVGDTTICCNSNDILLVTIG